MQHHLPNGNAMIVRLGKKCMNIPFKKSYSEFLINLKQIKNYLFQNSNFQIFPSLYLLNRFSIFHTFSNSDHWNEIVYFIQKKIFDYQIFQKIIQTLQS